MTREELAALCKATPSDWLYDVCKSAVHGSCYGLAPEGMSDNILKQSYKKSGEPLFVLAALCESLQRLFFSRYPGVKTWHRQAERLVVESGVHTSPSGQRRVFYGRRREFNRRTGQWQVCRATLREFLAHEPQNNTTYAVLLALSCLWNDPENRRSDTNELLVEPLHTVHDSLIVQWRFEHTAFARTKLREWFRNPLTIAGCEVVIPYEGQFGTSWGELGEKYGGGDL